MVINSSTINLRSARTYKASTSYNTVEQLTNKSTGETQTNSFGYTFNMEYNNYNNQGILSNSNNSYIVTSASNKDSDYKDKLLQSLQEFMEKIRAQLVKNLVGRNGNQESSSLTSSSSIYLTTNLEDSNLWNRTTTTSSSYTESESTSFSSTGTVLTADGREINFNIEMNMSREFIQENTAITDDVVAIYTDPLVINLDSSPTDVEDVTWNFDIDDDGAMDSISMLSKGNGFLALDHNNNGIIDNGSELFGSKSGNGFSDLSAYDTDKNGWIDENDGVYDDLRVWVKNNTEDSLLSLKEANVGAIYLGYSNTNFNLNNLLDNSANAQIKSTGIYLTESGEAKTIQQVDMAKKDIA